MLPLQAICDSSHKAHLSEQFLIKLQHGGEVAVLAACGGRCLRGARTGAAMWRHHRSSVCQRGEQGELNTC